MIRKGGIIPLAYFIMKKNHLLWFTKAKWNSFTIKKTVTNGFADFINNASASLIGIVFNMQLMSLIGSDGVVAYGIVMYVNYIATGIYMGYSVGIASIFVSYDAGLLSLTTGAIRIYSWSFLLCWFNTFTAAMFVALNKGKIHTG